MYNNKACDMQGDEGPFKSLNLNLKYFELWFINAEGREVATFRSKILSTRYRFLKLQFSSFEGQNQSLKKRYLSVGDLASK